MRLSAILTAIILLVPVPEASAGGLRYLTTYLLHREYAARHAPHAVTRTPREWIRGEVVVVTIKNSTILWPRFSSRNAHERLGRRFLEPLMYYWFLPLVEADCALNGHPSRPDYDWKLFGRNLE